MDDEQEESNNPPRGRPRKELSQLSVRSIRRRIGESFNPPPQTPSPRDLHRPPSDGENVETIHGRGVFFGDDDNSMGEEDLACAAGSGVDVDFGSGDPRQDKDLISESLPSDDQDLPSDEGYFDVSALGTLYYNCDICQSCLCVGCDICTHSNDGTCAHCAPCRCGWLNSSDDEDDESEVLPVDNVDSEEEEEVVSEEEKVNRDMKADLAGVCLKNGITHAAIDDILGFFHKYDIGNFPRTAKTLLKTAHVVHLKKVPPGEYWHNGITKHLTKYASESGCSDINITISSDGVPLFKSTGQSFWPVTCRLNDHSEVFVVGIYLGKEKPEDCNVFYEDFVREVIPLCENGLNVKGKIVSVNVVKGIFDAPASTFSLNTKSFNAYEGCFKCTTVGEMVNNTMCYPELTAPLRTDESFVNQEQSSYHKGDTILAEIPRFGCISNVPLDYMHLLLLGLMRKQLYMWIGGPLHVRVGGRKVTEMSDSLLSLVGWLPCEFTRRTVRSLKDIRRFKATEYRLMLLYTGITVFSTLPRPLYELFLVFHVITTIFIDPVFCKSEHLLDYAQELSVFFVQTFIDVYGRQYGSHNVHSLIHLHVDVRKFGNLDSFSAFPFENFYRSLVKLVRKGEKPLQQVAKRLLEQEANKCNASNAKPQPKPLRGSGQHSSGVLLDNCINPQYRSYTVAGGYTISSLSEPDKCCCLTDGSIVLVENFASNSDGQIVIIGKEFVETDDVYTHPIPSSSFGILRVRKLSKLKVWPASEIVRKCFRMPWKNGFVVLPLHKHE